MAKKKAITIDYEARVRICFTLCVTIFMYAMLTFFTLFFSDAGYGNITETKLATYTLFACLFVAAVVIAAVAFVAMRKTRPFMRPRTLLGPFSVTDVALLCYIVIATISTILSPLRSTSFWGSTARNDGLLIQLSYAFIFFVLSRFYKEQGQLTAFSITAVAFSFILITQYYGVQWAGIAYDMEQYGRTFLSTIGNINVVSTYLCFPIVIGAILYIKTTGKASFWWLAVAALCGYGSVLADTDSGYVGIIVTFAAALPFLSGSKRELQKTLLFAGLFSLGFVIARLVAGTPILKITYFYAFALFAVLLFAVTLLVRDIKVTLKIRVRVWYILLAAVIIIGSLLLVTLVQEPPENQSYKIFYDIAEVLRGNLNDHAGSGRGYVWKRAVPMALEHPLIGTGPDTFYNLFVERYGDESLATMGVHFDKPHNAYITVLFSTGILGLIAFLLFQGSLLVRAWKHLHKPIVLALAAALLCNYVQSFFNIEAPIVAPYAWIFMGMLGAEITRAGHAAAQADELAVSAKTQKRRKK